jgi:hypothetical protein
VARAVLAVSVRIFFQRHGVLLAVLSNCERMLPTCFEIV